MEGFASPLNCYFDTYCSAFVDTDAAFGSCGSFFDHEFESGCIEVNPPFVEEVMEPCRVAMLRQLRAAEDAGRSLCFLLVIPDWRNPPTPCIAALEGLAAANDPDAVFLRRSVRVDRDTHCYSDGFQHCLKEAMFRPVHHTMVYALQTSAAAARWPFDDAAEAGLKQAWADAATDVRANPLIEAIKQGTVQERGGKRGHLAESERF
jgi:hypothetical protein